MHGVVLNGSVQTGSDDVREFSRIEKLPVQWTSDDFAAGSRNSGKYFL